RFGTPRARRLTEATRSRQRTRGGVPQVCGLRRRGSRRIPCARTGGVAHAAAPWRVRRNMPDPVPAMVLGRLAVDRAFQDHGVGCRGTARCDPPVVGAAGLGGIRASLVRPMSEEAKRFYERQGFVESPNDPMTLMIAVADANRALSRR